jgi:hypothetical protein
MSVTPNIPRLSKRERFMLTTKRLLRSLTAVATLIFVCYITLALFGPLCRMEWRALQRGAGAAIVGSLIFIAGFGCLTVPCLMLCWVMLKRAWQSVLDADATLTDRQPQDA